MQQQSPKIYTFSGFLKVFSGPLLNGIQENPEAFRVIFVSNSDSPLTAEQLICIYKDPELASQGSNLRSIQVRTLSYWKYFVVDLEGMAMTVYS